MCIRDSYGISNKKAASILDTFSCIFQGILPYGAQMLVAISAASGLGETVSAFDILPRLFYQMCIRDRSFRWRLLRSWCLIAVQNSV